MTEEKLPLSAEQIAEYICQFDCEPNSKKRKKKAIIELIKGYDQSCHKERAKENEPMLKEMVNQLEMVIYDHEHHGIVMTDTVRNIKQLFKDYPLDAIT